MIGASSGNDNRSVPVPLRGHHFLCMLTYKGMGYSKPFVDNMSAVIARIASGAEVQLIVGADAICGGLTDACRSASGHDCNAADTLTMDEIAIEAVSRALNRDIRQLSPILPSEIEALRAAFAFGSVRKACARCPWFETCTAIAASGFEGVHLS
jgi:uncharacterized protein